MYPCIQLVGVGATRRFGAGIDIVRAGFTGS